MTLAKTRTLDRSRQHPASVKALKWQSEACYRYVRFGSKADICSALDDVRFTPNSDREGGFPHTVMSALPPKADMCSAIAHVCFGPIADIQPGKELSAKAY